ncbi:hypothetical protein [Streptomyces qinglanensis]|uniref:hypothetical protein n=1 Tax=Streptomyces qinglanensis TaxID=943816 RepID=UPI003D710BB2
MYEFDQCRETFTNLIQWNSPLRDLIHVTKHCDNRPGSPVYLDRSDVKGVLRRCVSGELDVAELPQWAGAVHMMERIEIDEPDETGVDLLTQFLFKVSSPELFEPVAVATGQRWLDTLA